MGRFVWITEIELSMSSKTQKSIEERVLKAAEEALLHHQYVSSIDVFTRMGLLQSVHVEDWKKGRILYLEKVIQGNLSKITRVMKTFQLWAKQRDLLARETTYLSRSRGSKRALQFSKSANPYIEKAYRTHYISSALSEKKQQKLLEKLQKPSDWIVFLVLRESQCSKCKIEIAKNSFLWIEGNKPLCLVCAGLNHLIYLPSGHAKLTRLAKKYSTVSTLVLKFSRIRNRYERQGLLVEQEALHQARQECPEIGLVSV